MGNTYVHDLTNGPRQCLGEQCSSRYARLLRLCRFQHYLNLTFKTSPRWPDGIWLKIDVDGTRTVELRGDLQDSTIAMIIDAGTGPKPVTNRTLAYHSNVGVGIPAAGVVWTGNFIWTISL